MYEEIWNRISNNCLKGNSVPEALKALWKEKLQGNAFLESWQFGGARLIDEYPEDIFFGYTAEFIGSQKDGDAWSRMFDRPCVIKTEEPLKDVLPRITFFDTCEEPNDSVPDAAGQVTLARC